MDKIAKAINEINYSTIFSILIGIIGGFLFAKWIADKLLR